MTTQFNETAGNRQNGKGNPPTHVAKVRHGHGKNASYEQIGAAWKNENGAVYVKLHGTQIVSAFTLYELPAPEAAEGEPSA